VITIMVLELKAPRFVLRRPVQGIIGRLLAAARCVRDELLGHRVHSSSTITWCCAPPRIRRRHSIGKNANVLFWISLFPLSTSILGNAPLEPAAVAFYGAVLTANAVSFTLLHRCALPSAASPGESIAVTS
jgi:hypothetical protein